MYADSKAIHVIYSQIWRGPHSPDKYLCKKLWAIMGSGRGGGGALYMYMYVEGGDIYLSDSTVHLYMDLSLPFLVLSWRWAQQAPLSAAYSISSPHTSYTPALSLACSPCLAEGPSTGTCSGRIRREGRR